MAMYLPNILEYPIILHGAAALGGIITVLSPYCTHDDLARYLKISRAKYLVTTPSLVEKALSAGTLKGIRCFVIGRAKNCESISSLLADDGNAFPKDVKINPKEDVVALPFSSGTTGVSKGVMLTHYNLIAQIRVRFGDDVSVKDLGTVINVGPLFTTYALAIILGGHFHIGNTIVLLSRFEPSTFLRAIQEYKVSFPGEEGTQGENSAWGRWVRCETGYDRKFKGMTDRIFCSQAGLGFPSLRRT